MFRKKSVLTIWISGRQLSLLGPSMASADSILFPGNVVSNMEVLNSDALYALIKEWTEKHPMKDTEIVWIFGPDVVFEHTMEDSESQEWDSVVVKFLDLLPFEEVESRVYSGTTGTKVVAINKDFYNALRRGFSLQGLGTAAEIAYSSLDKLAGSQGLNQQVHRYVVKNLDAIEKKRILSDIIEKILPNSETSGGDKSKSSLPLLLGVFVVLLAVLGLVIWRTYK